MAKFIIEVSDGYIRECADVENIMATYSGSDDFPKAVIMMLAFGSINDEIKKGNNEFVISSEDFKDAKEENALKLFTNLVELAATAITTKDALLRKQEKEGL